MADNVSDLGKARFDRARRHDDASPRDVLVEALRALEADEVPADHVIVIFGGINGSNECQSQWFQAGALPYYAQTGLLERTKLDMWDSVNGR